MTGQDIINRAWAITQDTEPVKRQPVAALLPMLNAGIRDLLSRRPGLLLDDDGALETFTDLTATTVASETLFVPDEYLEVLARYLAACVFGLDAEDEHNAGLANEHRQAYERGA